MDPVVSDVVGVEPTVTPVKKWWSMSRDMKILGMVVMVVGLGLGLLVVQQGTSVPMAARLRPRPTLAPRPSTPSQACPSAVYKYDGLYSGAPLANRPEVSTSGDMYVPFGQKVLKYSGPTPTITWAGKCKGGSNCVDLSPDIQQGHSDKFNCILNNGTSCITPAPADPHEYDWQFKDAKSATLDGNGYVYIADYYAHRIGRLGLNDGTYAYIGKCSGNVGSSTACDVAGEYANGFVCNDASCTRNFTSESGLGDRQFTNPAGVKVVGNELFVTDNRNSNNRVKVFGMSGSFLRLWNVDFAELSPTRTPISETVGGIDSTSGRVFVAANSHFDPHDPLSPDYWAGVMIYDANGNYIQNQQVISTRNDFQIRSVDVDETGTMYVAYSQMINGLGGWGYQHNRYEPQSVPPAPEPIVYTARPLELRKYTTGSNYQKLMLCDNKAIVSADSGATLYISSSYDPYDPGGTIAYCDGGGYPIVPSTGVMRFVCDGGGVSPTPTSTVPTNTPTRTPTPTQPQVSPTPTAPVTLEICQDMQMGPAGVSSNNDVQWYFVNNNANKYLHSVWLSWPTPVPPSTTPYIMNIQHYGSTVVGNPATIWTGNVTTSPFNNSTWIAGRDRLFGSTLSLLAINLNDAARAGHYTLVTRWALTSTGPAVCQSSPSTWVR